MDEKMRLELEIIDRMTLADELEHFRLKNYKTDLQDIIITDAKSDGRREFFYNFLLRQPQILFNSNIHKVGSEGYDYVLIKEVPSPKALVDMLIAHDRKLILLDNDKVLSNKWYIKKLEGAVCSNPDSCVRWQLNINSWQSYPFKGKVLMITNKTKYELRKNKNLCYILRDSILY